MGVFIGGGPRRARMGICCKVSPLQSSPHFSQNSDPFLFNVASVYGIETSANTDFKKSKTMKRPQENANKDPIDYFPGPIDFAAVEEFVTLLDPKSYVERVRHVGHLAVSFLANSRDESAEDSVRVGIEIENAAKNAMNLKRHSILSQMNGATLGRLLENLRNLESAWGRVDDREHGPYDSILRTVEERSKLINDNPPIRFNAAVIENALLEVDARMKHGQTRPSTPCDLKTALRYVASPASTPPDALELAFIDFLALHKLERVKKCDAEEELTLLSQLESNLKLEEMVRRNWKLGADHPVRKFLKAVIKDMRDRLSCLEQRKSILQSFVPGSKVRDPVFEEMAKLVESDWKRSDSVSPRTLAWLSVDFYPFWKKHKKVYIDLHGLSETERIEMKSIKTTSGRSALEKRELDKTLLLVQKWLDYADSRNKHPKDVIERFVTQSFKNETAQNKLSVFLALLLDHVVRNGDPKDVVKTLCEKHDRKVMTVEIVEGCAKELIHYLQKNE